MPVKKRKDAPGILTERTLTTSQEIARIEMQLAIDRLRLEHEKDIVERGIPRGWRGLEDEFPSTPKKVRMTAAFDEDVMKFFRSTGRGYQAKMNAVLRCYMHAVRSKYIEKRTDRTWEGDPI